MKLLLVAFALLLPGAAIAQSATDDLYRRGVAARYAGQIELATELLSQAAAAQPANSDVQLQLGLSLLAAGRLNEAEAALRRTLALAPDYADARVGLARVAQRRGHLKVALAELDQVSPGSANAKALRRQILQTAAAQADWRLDLDGGYSLLDRDRSDWVEASFRIGRHLPGRTLLSAVRRQHQ
jgi:tetratricopeptide (TPR) repeat protein